MLLVIVFANRRDQVRRVYERLQKQGLDASCRERLTQVKRTNPKRFKSGRIRVLIATDVGVVVFTSMVSAMLLTTIRRRTRGTFPA